MPGIFLNTYVFDKLPSENIRIIKESGRLYEIGTDKNNLVFHPTKENILKWTISKMRYKLSWGLSLSLMKKKRAYLYKLLRKNYAQRMIENFLKYASLNNTILEQVIGYVFVTKYYKKVALRYDIKTFLKNLLNT